MKNVYNEPMPDHEVAYMEERKLKCEYCAPEHESTVSWLESVTNQDLVFALYERYGIPPAIIYSEFQEELSIVETDEQITSLVEELEGELQEH